MQLLTKLQTWLETHRLAATDDLWLVAVSGGPDSLALLHGLCRLQPRFGLRLHVATFDHQLRGPASARDVRFVRLLSTLWGIPVTTGSADVRSLAEHERLSIEAAARQARYAFLAETARQTGAHYIATGHNADDQSETILMHILRGAGLAGVSGMRPQAPLPGAPDLTLVRPLLEVTRAEVEAYCSAHDLRPRVDATNDVPLYLRNRLRLEVMPLLREINPQVARQLRQLGESSALDNAYIEEAFDREILPLVRAESDIISLPLAAFRTAHAALQRRFVVKAARMLNPQAEISYVQQLAAVAVAISGQVGQRSTLPGSLQLRVDYDTVFVEQADRDTRPDGYMLEPGTTIPVALPGVTAAGSWAFAADENTDAAQARLVLPADARAVLRTRLPGDRFRPLGLGGHSQKLKAWLINNKVPQHQRDRLPLLVVDGEIAAIVWGAPWPISERFAVGRVQGPVMGFRCDAR